MKDKDQGIEANISRAAPSVLAANGDPKPGATGSHFSENVHKATRILVRMPSTGADLGFRSYSEYLSTLLHGQITYLLETSGDGHSSSKWALNSYDLVLQSVLAQRKETPQDDFVRRQVLKHQPPTILLVQQPRWPIQKILLVIRVEASEKLAVDWAGRLAHLCGAQLTVLPLVPSQSLISGPVSHLHNGLESLLTQNTPSGERLRSFLNQLKHWQVNGTLRVRQGDPLWQICLEIEDGKYDLVIMGAERHSRFRRLLFGDLVYPLLSRINRPLLIAGTKKPQPRSSKTEQRMRDI